MKTNFGFEFIKTIASLIFTFLISRFIPEYLKSNEELYTGIILILAFALYFIVKLLFAIIFPIRIDNIIKNNSFPNKQETHIVYSQTKKFEKEIKIQIKITFKYLTKVIFPLLNWLMKDTSVLITIETSEESIYLRGDSYKIMQPYNEHNASIDITNKLEKMLSIKDVKDDNSNVYNIYVRIKNIDPVLINTNIVTNLIFESESKFKKSLLKILTLKKRQKHTEHKIYIYEQEYGNE